MTMVFTLDYKKNINQGFVNSGVIGYALFIAIHLSTLQTNNLHLLMKYFLILYLQCLFVLYYFYQMCVNRQMQNTQFV